MSTIKESERKFEDHVTVVKFDPSNPFKPKIERKTVKMPENPVVLPKMTPMRMLTQRTVRGTEAEVLNLLDYILEQNAEIPLADVVARIEYIKRKRENLEKRHRQDVEARKLMLKEREFLLSPYERIVRTHRYPRNLLVRLPYSESAEKMRQSMSLQELEEAKRSLTRSPSPKVADPSFVIQLLDAEIEKKKSEAKGFIQRLSETFKVK